MGKTKVEHLSEDARYGGIAQLGERLLCKQEVNGSIPFISTIQYKNIEKAPLFPPDRAQRSGSGWKEERQRSEGAFSAGGSGGYGVCLDEGS